MMKFDWMGKAKTVIVRIEMNFNHQDEHNFQRKIKLGSI